MIINVCCYIMTTLFLVLMLSIYIRKKYYNVSAILKHREDLRKTLQVAVKSLKKVNAIWWLESGSLLGALRNNKIIPHDDDCDIGVLNIEKHLDELTYEVVNEGCSFYCDDFGIYKISYNGQFTDLFPRYINDEEKRYKSNHKIEKLFPQDIYTYEDVGKLRTIIFENLICNIPEFSEKIMTNIYGKDCLKISCITHLHSDSLGNISLPICFPT